MPWGRELLEAKVGGASGGWHENILLLEKQKNTNRRRLRVADAETSITSNDSTRSELVCPYTIVLNEE